MYRKEKQLGKKKNKKKKIMIGELLSMYILIDFLIKIKRKEIEKKWWSTVKSKNKTCQYVHFSLFFVM